MLNLKKWVGCWWITSRSGWLLELLTELTNWSSGTRAPKSGSTHSPRAPKYKISRASHVQIKWPLPSIYIKSRSSWPQVLHQTREVGRWQGLSSLWHGWQLQGKCSQVRLFIFSSFPSSSSQPHQVRGLDVLWQRLPQRDDAGQHEQHVKTRQHPPEGPGPSPLQSPHEYNL